ncbi:cis-prenyltransferase [Orbilia ellipsospora]|uniref:Alkyl transferase n=1 Tax=Orbilia ellipsospora TaxID=2528407 RepID=A0AAV9XK50_9PEZI
MPSSGLRNSLRTRRWFSSLPPIEWLSLRIQEALIGALRQGPIPQHVAFVMDGNRRFARQSHIETTEGHNLGFEALAKILEICYKAGVKVVTVYAFSIENFKRSKYEVDALMDIAKIKLSQLSQHGDLLDRYGAKIRILGHRSLVNQEVLEAIDRAMELTKHNNKAILNVCFPYTSRDEITSAIQSIVALAIPTKMKGRQLETLTEEAAEAIDCAHEGFPQSRSESPSSNTTMASTIVSGSPAALALLPREHVDFTGVRHKEIVDLESISEQTVTDHLFTADNPPLDLLIRTSGVERLSDFMLWQVHQDTDVEFIDCMWPEFDVWHFLPILLGWGLKRKRFLREMKLDDEQKHNRGSTWAKELGFGEVNGSQNKKTV